jgi:hypothetical protein
MSPHQKMQAHKERRATERGQKTVDTFKVAHRGFRRVFSKHFGHETPAVETVSYHLAQVEASLPSAREAIRLARYPKAGDRNPRRMALGLMENLAVLESHLRKANEALEALASGRAVEKDSEEE